MRTNTKVKLIGSKEAELYTSKHKIITHPQQKVQLCAEKGQKKIAKFRLKMNSMNEENCQILEQVEEVRNPKILLLKNKTPIAQIEIEVKEELKEIQEIQEFKEIKENEFKVQKIVKPFNNETVLLKKSINSITIIHSPIQLFLMENSPRKPYHSRTEREKEEVVHWGQRKLLIAETWFLTKYGHLSTHVIYAGAAPGHHIPLLSEMFKNHKFYLYDPNDFYVEETPRLQVLQKMFTETEAKIVRDKFQVQFVQQNIRTANFRQMTPLQNEQAVLRDNNLQMKWVEILQPQKSLLKFRCAYPTEITEPTIFFQGEILIQPWAPQSSTETRLVPTNIETNKEYDNLIYEEQLFYHNDVIRKEQKGLQSWDERAEIQILSDYMGKFGKGQDLNRQVLKLQSVISQKLNIYN